MKHFNPTPNTLEELKKMYRKLALKNHPDCGFGGGNAERHTVTIPERQIYNR